MKENLSYLKGLIKNTFKEFKNGTKTMFKEFFNKETNKKQRANMWTFIRLIIPLITLIMSVCAIIVSSPVLFVATGLVAGFGAVTDYLDGKSSRKYGSASSYGKLLDQVSDKFFAGVIGINLSFINPFYLFVLLGELLIAVVNIGYKVKYKDLDITSTKIGKIKEWPLFITLALGFLSPISPTLLSIANISLLLTTMLQLTTAASYIEANNKEVKNLKNKEIIKMCDEIAEENKKELELTKSKSNSRLEQYKKLRDVLKQVIQEKKEENITNNIQKSKKL